MTTSDPAGGWRRTDDAADYGDRLLAGAAVHLRGTTEADCRALRCSRSAGLVAEGRAVR